jgi:hypothetical protein
MALSSDFYADCAVGAVAVRARRSYKNGGFHSDPIAADGFGVDSFTDTRAAPSWRISLSNRVTILRGILSYLRQQQASSKFGAAQRYRSFIRHSAVRRHAVDYAPEMLAKLRQEVVGAIPDWRDMVSAPDPRRKPSAAAL